MVDNIEELKNTIINLENKIKSLKSQLQVSLEKENFHQSTLSKIKKIHSEYEESYLSSLNDYKNRENALKTQYLNYQNLLEKQYAESEKRLNDEIILLKNQINKKDEIISFLKKQNNEINGKVSKNEIDYHFKEKQYEEEILAKNRELYEMQENIKQLTSEAKLQIKNLYEQLYSKKQNASDNILDNLQNDINFNFDNINLQNDNYVTFQPQRNNNLDMNNIKLNNVILENVNNTNYNFAPRARIHALENENQTLREEIMKKEEEINFWKNNPQSYFKIPTSNINKQDYYNNIRIQQLEKMLENYGESITKLRETYNQSLIDHQNEMEDISNNYQNSINQIQLNNSKNMINVNMNHSMNAINYNTIPTITEKTVSNNYYANINTSMPNEEGMRNQYIKEKLEVIKKNTGDF